jgi:hypothetical protein
VGTEELIIFSSKHVQLMNQKLNFILVNRVDIGGVNTEIGDGTWFWKVSEAPSGRPLGRYRIRVTSINK